jgi:hypothetical protein
MAQQTDDEAEADELELTYDASHLHDDEKRGIRAREEPMVVLPPADEDGRCVGLYDVHTKGGEYTVEADKGVCDCPDFQYNEPIQGCKHLKRVILLLSDDVLPARGEPTADYDDALNELLPDIQERMADLRSELDALEGFAVAIQSTQQEDDQ